MFPKVIKIFTNDFCGEFQKILYKPKLFCNNYITKMNDQIVPYLSRINIESGTRKIPFLLYVTRGGKLNSLIFHFKEGGKYYQYCAASVTSKAVLLKCIYKRNFRSENCPATIKITPLRPDLIYFKLQNNKKRFFLNFDTELSEKSYEDWRVLSSNDLPHSTFCALQVPLKERTISEYVRENGTTLEIQNEKRKFCRFGPGQPLQRQFRKNHTQDAIVHGQVSIKKISKEMNFHLKGSEFLAKITSIKPEEKSSRYHQSKGRNNIEF